MITSGKWIIGLCFGLVCWCLASPSMAQNKNSVRFQKPFFAYLGMKGAGVGALGERSALLETKIRKLIERGRYLFVKIPRNARRIGTFQRKMVSIVAMRSKGVARMRSEWNSQFQGYLATTELLRSIQNSSYYYWINVVSARPVNVTGGNIRYDLVVQVHVNRLVIFDCSRDNRRLSALHRRSCSGRRNDEYAGFGRAYKVIKETSEGVNSSDEQTAFVRSVNNLRELLVKQIDKVKALQLHAPVMRATFNSLYFAMGKAEGLKLNQAFDVYVRHVRGHLIHKGYVRVRSIGDNRMKQVGRHRQRVNPKAPLFSTAQPLIGGSLQKGMLLYEHPHDGVFISVFGGMTPLTHRSFGGNNRPGGLIGPEFPLLDGTILIPTVRVGGGYDLSDAIGFNEVFLDLMLEIGVGGVGQNDAFVAPFLLWIGLTKRFYLRRFAFSVGARVGGGYVANVESGGLLGADALIGAEFLITPSFILALRVGFRAMIPIGTTISLGPWAVLGGTYSF